jgi:hypothetical protein
VNTYCVYDGKTTTVFTYGHPKHKENWHCEKFMGVKGDCKCVCHVSLNCALRHHHSTGYKKTFEHCG